MRRTAFQEIFEKHTWDIVVSQSYIPLYKRALPDGAAEDEWKEK
jgi:hypothetical protein